MMVFNAACLSRLFLTLLVSSAALDSNSIAHGLITNANTDTANPIRRVVSLLQNMAKKVEAEGKAADELFDKFMCYCKTGKADLAKSISDNDAKIPALQSDIEEAESSLATTKQELEQHQVDRDAAKAAMAKATAIREKEHEAYLKESGDLKLNIGAMSKAIPAIEKGMAGGFLQTKDATSIKRAVLADADLTEFDRDILSEFLQGGAVGEEGYVPKSGQIVGILKQMKEDFEKDLAGVEEQESGAQKIYDELMAAKTKEVQQHTEAIERKTALVGELSVEIVQMKNSLSEAEAAKIEDTKFLADLGTDCDTKEKEHEEQVKVRGEELTAISETIKILNDDDALDLFKKTLPSPSLLQTRSYANAKKAHAIALIGAVRNGRPEIDFIALALNSGKVDFSKVIKMIDDMVEILAKEQSDDDHKKEYCTNQLDLMEDKAKELGHTIGDTETELADYKETLKTVEEDLASLKSGIESLDKSVMEATMQRKKENEEYTELMASDTAAKELLEFAKNRLNKFYNPKLYKPPPKRELSEEEKIYASMGGEVPALLQVANSHRVKKDAPGPPPETATYKKKGEESTGVIAMIDMLKRDLDKEMTEADVTEKDSQKDYEQMMDDAAKKRAEDVKAITEKEGVKADTETSIANLEEALKTQNEELASIKEVEHNLHGECDWLIENFEVRKEARAKEVDALKNAKAILSGADFSFAQKSVGLLKHHTF